MDKTVKIRFEVLKRVCKFRPGGYCSHNQNEWDCLCSWEACPLLEEEDDQD